MPQPSDDEPNGLKPPDGEKPSTEHRREALQRAVDDMASGRLDAAFSGPRWRAHDESSKSGEAQSAGGSSDASTGAGDFPLSSIGSRAPFARRITSVFQAMK